ncbi:MAG: trimeric intracellular cation channel family protein [Raoultibacter sp.]
MLEVVLTVPFWLEFAACLAGGISGAMSAVKAKFDIFGTICIAVVCGLLGGIIRDILLQDYGIYAFQKPTLILACVIAAIVVFYFGKLITYLDPVVDFLDALSVGLWAVISVGKGLSAGLDVVPAVILGTITAVGGGIARDVLMNRDVAVFQAGTLYGSASLIGSIVFALMKQNHILETWAALGCVAMVLFLRYASEFFGWHTTPPRDYSDTVAEIVAKPAKAIAKKSKPPTEVGGKARRSIMRPVKKLDKTGDIGEPLELKTTKPQPKSKKHRSED